MEMIVGVFSFLLVIVCGQDVSFQYEQQCYSVKDSLTMTAVFSGSGTVTLVQWYYSNQTSSNLLITASSCDVFGTVPPGYPDASRMSYKCPTTHSLNTNTFELTLIGLKEDELEESWGATFSLSASASPVVNKSSITICATSTTTIPAPPTTTTSTTPMPSITTTSTTATTTSLVTTTTLTQPKTATATTQTISSSKTTYSTSKSVSSVTTSGMSSTAVDKSSNSDETIVIIGVSSAVGFIVIVIVIIFVLVFWEKQKRRRHHQGYTKDYQTSGLSKGYDQTHLQNNTYTSYRNSSVGQLKKNPLYVGNGCDGSHRSDYYSVKPRFLPYRKYPCNVHQTYFSACADNYHTDMSSRGHRRTPVHHTSYYPGLMRKHHHSHYSSAWSARRPLDDRNTAAADYSVYSVYWR